MKNPVCRFCERPLKYTNTTRYEYTGKRPKKCMAPVHLGQYTSTPCGSTDFRPNHRGGWDCHEGHSHNGKRKVVSRERLFQKPGYLGNGLFCTLTCGYKFALAILQYKKEGKP